MLTHDKPGLYGTHVDISEANRIKLMELLNQQLANTTDLKTQVKQAHWNVKGMHFISLHEMFDKFADTLEEYIDMTAERVTALGGVAMGTARIVASNSNLSEYDLTAVDGVEHLRALLERYGYFANTTRANIDKAEEFGDKDTADLFAEVSRQMDKDMWFIEAHLQGKV